MSGEGLFIRSATVADFDQCLAIDHSFQTSHVWQMDFSQQNGLANTRFQPVRLPRPLSVAYPYTPDELVQRWCQTHCFLVAGKDGVIVAYVTVTLDSTNRAAWISDMASATAQRRQGYGSRLLAAASQWARNEAASRLLAAVQTKNYPGIQFCQKNGLSFCGYHESWYRSNDIALFFSATL